MEDDLAKSAENLVREYNEIMLRLGGRPLRSIDVYDAVLLAQLANQAPFEGVDMSRHQEGEGTR